jgi:hypothetical protein
MMHANLTNVILDLPQVSGCLLIDLEAFTSLRIIVQSDKRNGPDRITVGIAEGVRHNPVLLPKWPRFLK